MQLTTALNAVVVLLAASVVAAPVPTNADGLLTPAPGASILSRNASPEPGFISTLVKAFRKKPTGPGRLHAVPGSPASQAKWRAFQGSRATGTTPKVEKGDMVYNKDTGTFSPFNG
ncbi:hypothetical protein Slin14017_G062980 [Septoria linicola]|nr:hypothetical protein Slin14017_G062980 [Septoria linicola]